MRTFSPSRSECERYSSLFSSFQTFSWNLGTSQASRICKNTRERARREGGEIASRFALSFQLRSLKLVVVSSVTFLFRHVVEVVVVVVETSMVIRRRRKRRRRPSRSILVATFFVERWEMIFFTNTNTRPKTGQEKSSIFVSSSEFFFFVHFFLLKQRTLS